MFFGSEHRRRSKTCSILQMKLTAGEVKGQTFTCWMKIQTATVPFCHHVFDQQGCIFKMTPAFHSERPSGSECCASAAVVLNFSNATSQVFISKQALETRTKPLTWTKKIQGTTTTNQTGMYRLEVHSTFPLDGPVEPFQSVSTGYRQVIQHCAEMQRQEVTD